MISVCGLCGAPLMESELKAGRCSGCGESLDAKGRPKADFDGEPAIPAAQRPAWGTVRAGLAFLTIGGALVWCSIGGMLYLGDPEPPGRVDDVDTRFRPGRILGRPAAWLSLYAGCTCLAAGVLMCGAIPRGAGQVWAFLGILALASLVVSSFGRHYMTQANDHKRLEDHRQYVRKQTRAMMNGDAMPRPPQSKPRFSEAAFRRQRLLSQCAGVGIQLSLMLFLYSVARRLRGGKLKWIVLAAFGVAAAVSACVLLVEILEENGAIQTFRELDKPQFWILTIAGAILSAGQVVLWLLVRRGITVALREPN